MAIEKVCKNCGQNFEIPQEDLDFYEKISPEIGGKKYLIPPPTFCRDCRLQRRISWRNERALYQRKCAKCGKDIISVFSNDKKTPVFCNKCWWSDSWDAHIFGRNYDPNKSFFEQFHELMEIVPQLAIQNDDGVSSVNCAYCQDFAYGKNCYFAIGSWYDENTFYSNVNSSYNLYICDCTNISHSELAYECSDSQHLYNCIFLQNSENCHDCFFGFDLKGCKNCFGCFGLRQKEYHIFNKPFSKAEYQQEIKKHNFDSYSKLQEIRAQFHEAVKQYQLRDMYLQHCENSEGNYLLNCNFSWGFALLDSDHSKYCDQCDNPMYSYDIYNSGKPLWCYEGITPDNSHMSHFDWFCWSCKNTLYSLNCHSCENIFGCISLHRAKYSIFNKQYTKEEYEELVPEIIENMRAPASAGGGKKSGEYGEFFPTKMSYFDYNETVAQELFPLTKENSQKLGYKWKNPDPKEYLPQKFTIPDKISEVPDSITKEVLACSNCGKNYKILPAELDLYRKMNLAIPRKCPDCRHKERIGLRAPYKLFSRNCAKCKKPIKTSYSETWSTKVCCEECYLKEVY